MSKIFKLPNARARFTCTIVENLQINERTREFLAKVILCVLFPSATRQASRSPVSSTRLASRLSHASSRIRSANSMMPRLTTFRGRAHADSSCTVSGCSEVRFYAMQMCLLCFLVFGFDATCCIASLRANVFFFPIFVRRRTPQKGFPLFWPNATAILFPIGFLVMFVGGSSLVSSFRHVHRDSKIGVRMRQGNVFVFLVTFVSHLCYSLNSFFGLPDAFFSKPFGDCHV